MQVELILKSQLTMARVIEPIGLLLLQRATYATKKAKIPVAVKQAKIKQSATIKALHRENKEIFGQLLESKQERVRKQKTVKRAEESLGSVSASLISDRSSNIITKAGERARKQEQSEVNWALKNFPGRTKVLSRTEPDKAKYTFDEASLLPTGHFQVFVKNPVSQGSEDEAQKGDFGSVRQFITSLQDCQDIGGSGEFKLIRRSTAEATSGNETNSYLADSVLINGNEAETQEWNVLSDDNNVEPVPRETVSTTANRDHDPPVRPDPDLPSASVGYKLFPFENPVRVEAEKNGEGMDIISLPFPRGVEGTNARLPSVSKILTATMPPEQAEVLKKWEQKMIAEMGEDGFKQYKEDLFRNGKELHANIETLLRGTPMEEILIAEPITGHWRSLARIVTEIQDVRVLESHVTHPELGYCGIVDCIAKYKDKLVVIDWKTSEKPKPFVSMTYDTPLQIAAYIGAINYDPNYSLKIREGLIVVAYKNGEIGQTFLLNSRSVAKYWQMWVRRLKLFQSQQNQANL